MVPMVPVARGRRAEVLLAAGVLLGESARFLRLLSGLYDQAARAATSL